MNKPYYMNVNHRFTTFILILFFVGTSQAATELQRCLSQMVRQEHRLEKEETLRYCFNKYKTFLRKDSCYATLTQEAPKLNSIRLTEEINSICFYETTPPKDINSCLKEVNKFKNTLNHDEAVFYCYEQFQINLTQKECLRVANHLIYPLKKDYLKQECDKKHN